MASIVTVLGMFSYLGTAYSTSIRLSAIQGFSPLKTSIAFVLINGITLVQAPITARVMQRYDPRWVLGSGFALVSLGDFWIASTSANNLSIAPIVAPLVLVGIGFAFSVSAVTAVAVNTVPNHLAGMASGSTSLLRDFGFTLGPAVIGAVALSQAAAEIQNKVASSATLRGALAAFNNSVASVPTAQKPAVEAAIGAANSGPLGANGVPATVTLPAGQVVPFNPLKSVAFSALDHAYSLGYVICGVAGFVAALLAVVALRGSTHDALISEESLAQDTMGEAPAPVHQPEAVTI